MSFPKNYNCTQLDSSTPKVTLWAQNETQKDLIQEKGVLQPVKTTLRPALDYVLNCSLETKADQLSWACTYERSAINNLWCQQQARFWLSWLERYFRISVVLNILGSSPVHDRIFISSSYRDWQNNLSSISTFLKNKNGKNLGLVKLV